MAFIKFKLAPPSVQQNRSAYQIDDPHQAVISQGDPNKFADEQPKLSFIKKAINVFLPKPLEFKPATEYEQRFKTQEEALAETGFIPSTKTKLPFVQKSFTKLGNNALNSIIKFAIETPERIVDTFKDVRNIQKTGNIEPRKQGELHVETGFDEREKMYQTAIDSGMSETGAQVVAGLYGGGQAVLDATILGSILNTGAKAILRKTATSTLEHQMAWKTLGMPKTLGEAKITWKKNVFVKHPDRILKTGISPEKAKQITTDFNNAWTVLEKQGIPQVVPKATQIIRDAARLGLIDVKQFVRQEYRLWPEVNQPFGNVAGLLPGTRTRATPAIGLQTSDVERVGYGETIGNLERNT